MSLLDPAAAGPKVLIGLCPLEAPLLESAEGRVGPGGRSGVGSGSPFPAGRKKSLVGLWGGAAPVDRVALAAAAAVGVATGTGAVERSRLLMALVVCDGLGVAGRELLGKITGPSDAAEVFWI